MPITALKSSRSAAEHYYEHKTGLCDCPGLSLMERWQENRIGPYFHSDFRFGWLGNGWNALQFGWMTFYLGSGPSPLARLRTRLGA